MKYGERKAVSKKMRLQVYNKYQGRCAYCGREIKMQEMQVDHIIPIAYSCYGPRDKAEEVRKMFEDESINAIDNLMPACRACNFYKGINDIERFRNRIKSELDHTCRQSFQTRLAMQYGMIKYIPWDGVFYFEKIEKEEDLVNSFHIGDRIRLKVQVEDDIGFVIINITDTHFWCDADITIPRSMIRLYEKFDKK